MQVLSVKNNLKQQNFGVLRVPVYREGSIADRLLMDTVDISKHHGIDSFYVGKGHYWLVDTKLGSPEELYWLRQFKPYSVGVKPVKDSKFKAYLAYVQRVLNTPPN